MSSLYLPYFIGIIILHFFLQKKKMNDNKISEKQSDSPSVETRVLLIKKKNWIEEGQLRTQCSTLVKENEPPSAIYVHI